MKIMERINGSFVNYQFHCYGRAFYTQVWNGHYEYEQFVQELLNANKQQATLHKLLK
jgi:hypothetical protein